MSREEAVTPAAAALVAAVANHDADEVARVLMDPGLDWMALCVVLADRVTRAPEGAWLSSLLADLRSADLTDDQIAARYGLMPTQLRRFCADNHIRRDWPEALEGGRWVSHRGIQVWVNDHDREAG